MGFSESTPMSSRSIRLEDIDAELLSLISETGTAWIITENSHLVFRPVEDIVYLQIGIKNSVPGLENRLLIAIADKVINELALSDFELGEVSTLDDTRWIELHIVNITKSVLIDAVHIILANLLDLTNEKEFLFLYC